MRSFAKKIGKRFRDFLDLYDEVQALKLHAYTHPDLQWVLPHVRDGDNRLGRFFNIVLTAIEAACTNTCIRFAIKHFGWKIMAIVHDGFNPTVKLNKVDQAFYCELFSGICEALFPGINMAWCVKPLDFMMYDKNGLELREFVIPADWQPPEDGVEGEEDIVADDEYEGDAEYFPSYNLVKTRHEENYFKVEALFVDLETHKGDTNQGLTVRSKVWMNDKFQNKYHSVVKAQRDDRGNIKRDKYVKVLTKRENVEFLSRWLKDPFMRQYTSFQMKPGGSSEGDTHYNMWKPYYVESIDPKSVDFEEGRRICIVYIDFLHKLFGEEEKQTMMCLDWKAHLFIFPHLKPKVMPCLLGFQGGGKTTVGVVAENMMGGTHCYTTTKPEWLVGNGNWAVANKKLAVINEVPPESVKKVLNEIKPLVTDSPLEHKSMGKGSYHDAISARPNIDVKSSVRPFVCTDRQGASILDRICNESLGRVREFSTA